MDQIAALRAFIAVSEAGGFAPAARRMGLATSSLTRQVDALEAKLAVKLLNRSTRSVTLTDAGQVYFEKTARILSDLQDADLALAGHDGPRGLLRVSAPLAFGRLHLAPLLAGYLESCPEVELDLIFTDSVTNLAEENVDVAIRIGALESSSLIARKLAPHRRVVCASPDYLEREGIPRRPSDLAEHACLAFTFTPGRDLWRFEGRTGRTEEVDVKGRIRANSSETLVQAAVAGLGVVMMPTWLVGADLQAGRLQAVLEDWRTSPGAMDTGIHAVYLANRRGVPKVRSFVEFLLRRWSPVPPWEILA